MIQMSMEAALLCKMHLHTKYHQCISCSILDLNFNRNLTRVSHIENVGQNDPNFMEAASLCKMHLHTKYHKCISRSILDLNFNRKLNLMCDGRTEGRTDERAKRYIPSPNSVGRGDKNLTMISTSDFWTGSLFLKSPLSNY